MSDIFSLSADQGQKDTSDVLYFAYGSNMEKNQLDNRCPSAKFVSVAKLPDCKFGFTRFSKNRNCGVMDIIDSPGDEVWGVIFKISARDLKELDKNEGYDPERSIRKNAYCRKKVIVYREGKEKQKEVVYTYEVVNKSITPIPPSDEYMSLILKGADQWKLPVKYIQKLSQTLSNQ